MSNNTCSAYRQRHSERGQLRSVSLIVRRSHAARCARPDGMSDLLAQKVETDCADRAPRRDNHDSYGACAGTWHGADLGCGRCDLGRFADYRGSRSRLETIRVDETTSYEILTYLDRGSSLRDCERQGSTRPAAISKVMNAICRPTERRQHRFSGSTHGRKRQICTAMPAESS